MDRRLTILHPPHMQGCRPAELLGPFEFADLLGAQAMTEGNEIRVASRCPHRPSLATLTIFSISAGNRFLGFEARRWRDDGDRWWQLAGFRYMARRRTGAKSLAFSSIPRINLPDNDHLRVSGSEPRGGAASWCVGEPRRSPHLRASRSLVSDAAVKTGNPKAKAQSSIPVAFRDPEKIQKIKKIESVGKFFKRNWKKRNPPANDFREALGGPARARPIRQGLCSIGRSRLGHRVPCRQDGP